MIFCILSIRYFVLSRDPANNIEMGKIYFWEQPLREKNFQKKKLLKNVKN